VTKALVLTGQAFARKPWTLAPFNLDHPTPSLFASSPFVRPSQTNHSSHLWCPGSSLQWYKTYKVSPQHLHAFCLSSKSSTSASNRWSLFNQETRN
jgi:hypothetical protein